ncbi:hypothetical protein DFS34DRAFT_608385 [Phlyctochytrium arcticum]|nr:hypothetical protein DFS34DRAFT_608385 [Phlyctochytrium arcticum]
MSSESDLRCNNLQCRTALPHTTRACVTTCSHIFCVECAQTAFSKALICPACDTSLNERDDIVFAELNPSEDYKSSVLAGLRPEVIIEIAGRAMSFWVYQTSQEAIFRQMMYRTLVERNEQLENQVQKIVRDANQEIQSLRTKLSYLQKDREKEQLHSQRLLEENAERGRQYQKLQMLYDRLKRKTLVSLPIPPPRMDAGSRFAG